MRPLVPPYLVQEWMNFDIVDDAQWIYETWHRMVYRELGCARLSIGLEHDELKDSCS